MHADELIRPWYEALEGTLPVGQVFDAHTHTGHNDPDGFRARPDEVIAALDEVGGRAVVFSMHEPHGFAPANDRVLAEAADSDGRLVPFVRVDPARGARSEAERCLDAGARGIKLHPRGEGFALDHPAVDELFALSAERRLPVLVHAGRGIPALGRHALALVERHPGANVILAHAGISDLSWIWRRTIDNPSVFFDTSWWNPTDLLVLLSLVPPGQILFASDCPYGTPLLSSLLVGRCAAHAGLDAEQLRAVFGGQLARLLAGEEPLDHGPAPGAPAEPLDLVLERICSLLYSVVGRLAIGADATELLDLTRLACEVGEDSEHAETCRSVLALLDRHDRWTRARVPDGTTFPGAHVVVAAVAVARTPGVVLPRDPEGESVAERVA